MKPFRLKPVILVPLLSLIFLLSVVSPSLASCCSAPDAMGEAAGPMQDGGGTCCGGGGGCCCDIKAHKTGAEEGVVAAGASTVSFMVRDGAVQEDSNTTPPNALLSMFSLFAKGAGPPAEKAYILNVRLIC